MMGIENLGWRKKRKSLWATPIYKDEFPLLYKSMINDNLRFEFEENMAGYQWYLGRYPITAKAIRDVWGLTHGQYRRFISYIVENVDLDGEFSG